MQASKEAVEVYRDILDCEHAQRNEFDFASILNGLSNRYAETGSPKEALPMMEQAVELFRKLA